MSAPALAASLPSSAERHSTSILLLKPHTERAAFTAYRNKQREQMESTNYVNLNFDYVQKWRSAFCDLDVEDIAHFTDILYVHRLTGSELLIGMMYRYVHS